MKESSTFLLLPPSHNPRTPFFKGELLLCLTSVICAWGCAAGPDFVRPEPPKVELYTDNMSIATIAADGQAQRIGPGTKMTTDWWRRFNSPKIDAVMIESLSNNPTLQAAQASLRRSRENLLAGYGVFYPQLDAGAGVSRQRVLQSAPNGVSAVNIFSLYTLAAGVSYALDIFGGERRAVEGLQAEVDFQRYMVLGTYLTQSANVVNTMIAQAAYREQIEATEQIIALQREQVEIADSQLSAGIVPYTSVLNLRSQLYATEAAIPLLKQRLSQAVHLLAVLVGKTPAEWASPEVLLTQDLTLPDDLPLTLPSDLVRRRPDILAAEAQLHSASASIGTATASMFPSFTLTGSYGMSGNSAENFFTNATNVWGLGANLSVPLLHGGSLWSRRQAAIEAYNQSQAVYRQTVLSAFAQVADVLRALEHDAEALQAQSQALNSAEEALQIVQANYRAGIANYLQMLVTDYQYRQAKIAYLQALAQRFQDTVALFVAMGGGWWNDEEGGCVR